jgi:hypothetical protein
VSGAGDQGHACVWQPLASGRDLRVEIDATPVEEEPAHRAVIEEAWERIRAANPRAFNGPILAYLASGPENNLVVCRRDEYRRLAVLPEIETGLVQLGVTGVLEARDEAGTRHVLLGLRSHATRVFGGRWEFGPSGGVDPPPVGLPVDPDPTPPLGLLHEPVGRSCELVVRVSIRRPVEELIALIDRENRTSRWEYDAVRWVAVDELGAFVDAHPAIPSALALAELVPSWV